MESVDLMLVGCGMMGLRHVRGYGELEKVRPGAIRLRAVCDPRLDAAARVAEEAERLLGHRPTICRSAEEALHEEPSIRTADVVVRNRLHDAVAIPLLGAGLDVHIEKPLAVTIGRARAIVHAARRAGRILAVAENNRRDPMNRLQRHVIQSGLIGQPNFAFQVSIGGGRRVIASPWRHELADGGLLLDVGIHQAYVLEMLLGPVERVAATTQRVWPSRVWTSDGTTQSLPAESEDVASAILTFENGVQGAWVFHYASVGRGQWQRTVFGDGGTMDGPPDRSGGAVHVVREGEALSGEALLEAMPEFGLNPIESRLFGARPAGYALEGPETDRKLIAAELADFVDSVRERREPEVPGEVGIRAPAVVYAVLESALAGSPIEVADVLSGAVSAYQRLVEAAGAIDA